MTSPIGDLLLNPKIEGSTANDKMKAEERSMIANALKGNKGGVRNGRRLLNDFNKELASLPDLLLNAVSGGGYLFPKDPVEKGLKAIGSIRDFPEAETTGEKLSGSVGRTLGSLALPIGLAAKGAGTAGKALGRALLGTNAPLTSASQLANPAFGSTVGGAAAQAVLQPQIEENFPNSPAAQFALSLGTGALGGLAGGLGTAAALRGSPKPLPRATAAQMGDINDPRTKDLIARQLDLAKKDPKSADILSQISQNQEASILGKLETQNPIDGTQIVEEITNSIQQLKSQRAEDYQNAYNSLVANAPPEGISIEGTMKLIGELQNKTARGSPLQNALRKASDLIVENSDNPERLISAKTAIQDLTEPTSGLNLGSKQSVILQKITKQLNEDIGKSLPGYDELNKTYSAQTKNIETLLEGAVGKAAGMESNKPSAIIQQIFEKTDPELVGQLKQVLPQEIYEQAADMYLADVARRGMETPTKNTINKINQYQKIANILEKNRSTLRETLPEAQNSLVDEIIGDIKQTSTGRPRNDFAVDARRGVAVGDEAKGLGKIPTKIGDVAGSLAAPAVGYAFGGPVGAAAGAGIGAAGKKLGSSITNYLGRNEILTGQSPGSQVIEGLGNPGTRLGQKFASANALSQDEGQIPQQQLPQPQMAANASMGQQISPQENSFDDLAAKYGLNESSSEQKAANEPSGSFNDLADKYGLNDQSPKSDKKNLFNKIKYRESSNNYGAINDQGYTGAYQMGAQALEDAGLLKPGASRKGNQALDNPENWTIPGGKEAFLSNPQLQDAAMQSFTDLNEQRLLAKGLIGKSTPQSQRDGYLAAAHLGGVGGASALAKGLMRRDRNGTSTRDYYNMGAGV